MYVGLFDCLRVSLLCAVSIQRLAHANSSQPILVFRTAHLQIRIRIRSELLTTEG